MKIGVVIMLAERPDLRRAPTFQEIRDQALLVEQLGFDSIWLYDHLLYRYGKKKTTGIWESWTMLSALAAVIPRLELGILVTCISFRNPAILAKMAHTVDEISGGRLILGLGAGWNKPEYEAFGIQYDHRVDHFEEAIQIIRPLIKEGRADYEGKYYSAHNCEITPRSPRPEGPPILIGSFGPRMMRLTAKYADLWNTGYLSLPRALIKPRRDLWKACREIGREPSSLPITGMVSLAYPDLLGSTKPTRRGSLTGNTQEIAAALAEFESLGAVHLMLHMIPSTKSAFERFSEAMTIYRKAYKTHEQNI
jgi:alkanesulfonate monooxygenase SsuD/methylene tetrahydromethanopterin reductase-like flavin-dependent oxidoreductase (luciferase family)